MATIVIEFDPDIFRLQFPAFENVTTYPDAMLQRYWDMATCYISDEDYGYLTGNCRRLALDQMTAHLLFCANLIASGQVFVLVQSSTIDKITVSLTPPPLDSGDLFGWWLMTSPYGIELQALLSVNSVGGFSVGGSPEISGFRRLGGCY